MIEAAAREGYPRNPDYNNGHQEGFGYYQVTQKNGRRWSTARALPGPGAPPAEPARGNRRARHAASSWTASARSACAMCSTASRSEARCGGEVLVAAGAVKSPHLLELSGIGQPALLGRSASR